jgi:hypothetical protein
MDRRVALPGGESSEQGAVEPWRERGFPSEEDMLDWMENQPSERHHQLRGRRGRRECRPVQLPLRVATGSLIRSFGTSRRTARAAGARCPSRPYRRTKRF